MVRLSKPLQVNVQDAFQTAQAVAAQAQELRDHLLQITQEWEQLSDNWEGKAASAYSPAWTEWHDNASIVVQCLVESSEKLMRAAIAYEEQDHAGGYTINSAGNSI